MKETVIELGLIIRKYEAKLKHVSEADFTLKASAEKWSKKEELGHLIDSAHNNLRRFIVSQYEWVPKVVYDQNAWVRISNYQNQSSADLISLWFLLNKQICEVLRTMPESAQEKFSNTGKEKEELHTLTWLAKDYVKHLLHHVHHILELEAVAYP
jgi:hypothetical protein